MQPNMLDKYETVRTTVTLPVNLLQRSQGVIDSGKVPNRNALVVAALEQFITHLEREEIDRQFAAMADDADYLSFQTEVAESFAESDWEALGGGETTLE
ncbi:MAG: CopG family transcriptional regulator [Chloroflexi bacterium]|nr:CopG family transcriptional regulator [Chloroflexota bacterium]